MTLTIISGATFSDGASTSVTVVGTTSVSPADYLGAYGPMLEAAGFAPTTNLESQGNVTAFYENPLWFLSYSGSIGDDGTTINISVTTADN